MSSPRSRLRRSPRRAVEPRSCTRPVATVFPLRLAGQLRRRRACTGPRGRSAELEPRRPRRLRPRARRPRRRLRGNPPPSRVRRPRRRTKSVPRTETSRDGDTEIPITTTPDRRVRDQSANRTRRRPSGQGRRRLRDQSANKIRRRPSGQERRQRWATSMTRTRTERRNHRATDGQAPPRGCAHPAGFATGGGVLGVCRLGLGQSAIQSGLAIAGPAPDRRR